MKINALYPVVIPNWRMPNHKTEKNVLGFAKTVVEIPEITSSECPVVLRSKRSIRSGKKAYGVEFRHDGRNFYEEIDQDFEWLLFHLEEAPLNRFSYLGQNLIRLASRYLDEPKRAFPKGIVRSICDLDPEGDFRLHSDEIRKIEPQIMFSQETLAVLREEYGRAIEEAETSFHEACSNFLIVDGKLLARTSEPIISVNTITSPGRILIDWFYEDNARSTKVDEYFYTNILFGVSEFDSALRTAKALGRESNISPWGDIELENVDPAVFSSHLPLQAIWAQRVLLARILDLDEDKISMDDCLSLDERSVSDALLDFSGRIPTDGDWRVEGFKRTLERWEQRPIEVAQRSVGSPKP